MGPFCPLGISRVGPVRKSSLFGHIKNPLLTTGKLVRSRWLYIGFVFFFAFLLTSNLGGGGGHVCTPTIQTSVKCRDFDELYIFVSFQQVTFKLGNFTNLKALFSVVSTDFPFFPCQKLRKNREMVYPRQCYSLCQ